MLKNRFYSIIVITMLIIQIIIAFQLLVLKSEVEAQANRNALQVTGEYYD